MSRANVPACCSLLARLRLSFLAGSTRTGRLRTLSSVDRLISDAVSTPALTTSAHRHSQRGAGDTVPMCALNCATVPTFTADFKLPGTPLCPRIAPTVTSRLRPLPHRRFFISLISATDYRPRYLVLEAMHLKPEDLGTQIPRISIPGLRVIHGLLPLVGSHKA